MDWSTQRLFDQVEGVDKYPHVEQATGLELGEVGDPQADRPIGVEGGEGVAHHRCRRILTQHDGFTIETVNPDIVGDLPANVENGGLAPARAVDMFTFLGARRGM